MVDMWPLVGSVWYGSTNQSNSAFHPSGIGKWVVIHVIAWMTGVEWRPLNDKPGLCMAVWLRVIVRGCGLSLRPIGYTPALSVTKKRRYSCSLWRYISVICLPFGTSTANPPGPACIITRETFLLLKETDSCTLVTLSWLCTDGYSFGSANTGCIFAVNCRNVNGNWNWVWT